MAGNFEKAGENLVRHSSGTYYVRAKINGKPFRASLKTTDLRVAKILRNERLADERAKKPSSGAKTIRAALEKLQAELCDRPHIAPKTKEYGKATIAILTRRLPLDAASSSWSVDEAEKAWRLISRQYSASVANKALSAMRRLAAIIIESGARTDDPTAKLVRMPARKAARKMPSKAEMDAMIEHVRTAGKKDCIESAHMIAIIAFSGMRVGEARSLKWGDVGKKVMTIASDGRNKTRKSRELPINAPLKAALAAMDRGRDGAKVLGIASPRRALKSACEAVGVHPMRVHDLRHFFATWCIESGVDIPTVAKWLGHSDGGALAMKTYGHVRDEHGMEAVKKLS